MTVAIETPVNPDDYIDGVYVPQTHRIALPDDPIAGRQYRVWPTFLDPDQVKEAEEKYLEMRSCADDGFLHWLSLWPDGTITMASEHNVVWQEGETYLRPDYIWPDI